jgi:hypothetical protein
LIAGNAFAARPNANCGSSGVGSPRSSAFAPAGLAATAAPLARWIAAMPPA